MQDCSLEDINVYVWNLYSYKRTLIEDIEDKEEIINRLNSLNVKHEKDGHLGGWCSLLIENKKTNEKLKIEISRSQIYICNKLYTIDKDIFNTIKNICLKYDDASIYN